MGSATSLAAATDQYLVQYKKIIAVFGSLLIVFFSLPWAKLDGEWIHALNVSVLQAPLPVVIFVCLLLPTGVITVIASSGWKTKWSLQKLGFFGLCTVAMMLLDIIQLHILGIEFSHVLTGMFLPLGLLSLIAGYDSWTINIQSPWPRRLITMGITLIVIAYLAPVSVSGENGSMMRISLLFRDVFTAPFSISYQALQVFQFVPLALAIFAANELYQSWGLPTEPNAVVPIFAFAYYPLLLLFTAFVLWANGALVIYPIYIAIVSIGLCLVVSYFVSEAFSVLCATNDPKAFLTAQENWSPVTDAIETSSTSDSLIITDSLTDHVHSAEDLRRPDRFFQVDQDSTYIAQSPFDIIAELAPVPIEEQLDDILESFKMGLIRKETYNQLRATLLEKQGGSLS